MEDLFDFLLIAVLTVLAIVSLICAFIYGAWWQLVIACGAAILAAMLTDEKKKEREANE